MSSFIPTKAGNPCSLCDDTTGKCRETTSDLRLCMQHTDAYSFIPGWQFVGRTKDGLWGQWVPDTGSSATPEQKKQWRQEQALNRQLRAQAEAQQRADALPAPQRDRHYRHLLSQLSLHPDDKADLLQRGLTEEEIQKWGVKSVKQWQKLSEELPYKLPGVALDGISLNTSQPGYLCPIIDVEGYIVGFQVRLRDNQVGRYRWFTSRTRKRPDGATPHLPNGELPLAVHRPTQVTRQAIVLVEGVGAKPFLTAHRRGQITVGAAGGLFASSPQTLKETLDRLTAETGNNLIEFAIDAGAISNKNVLGRYRATWKRLQEWGYEVSILWWGQVSKSDRDIDELEDLSCIEAITVEQFESIVQGADGVLDRLLKWLDRSKRKQKASPKPLPVTEPTDPAIVEYEFGKRLKTWQTAIQQGSKIILDLSSTGGGKSYSAGQLTPELLEVRQLIYASEQHRNPTVDTLSLENGWVDLEARHGGLMREKTVDGSTRLKRTKPGESHAVAPNCNRVKVLQVLREKNIAGADTANRICGTCPLKGACQHQQGPGYGFLNQRQAALASPKLRAHPHSLPDPTEYDFSSVVLIWEEAACSFTISRSIQVDKNDLQALINHLLLLHPDLFQQVQPLLTQLLNLFDGNIRTGKFGLSHLELTALLPAVTDLDPATIAQAMTADLKCLNTTAEYGVDLADLPKTLQKQFLEKDSTQAEQAERQILKQWFVELLTILQGTLPGGSVQFHRNQLTLTLPDDRHRVIAQAAKVNIFLDATLSREDLALKLGCAPEEIFVCRQKQPLINNLKLTQVMDMGMMGMNRGANQQKRLAALLQHYRQVDPTTKVIDFKKFEQEGAHWRDSRGVNYFSETTTLVIVGAPCPNLHEMLAQYATLIGQVVSKNDPVFQAWLHRQIEAEVQQEIGRLRANRRPTEQLHVVIVTDRPFSFPVEAVKASDITPTAATKSEQVILAAKQAIEWLQHQGERVTQTAVAHATKNLGLNEGKGYSQQHISRCWQLLILLIEGLTSKMSKPKSDSLAEGELERLEVLGQVLEEVSANPDLEAVLLSIKEDFWEWLRPDEWLLVWQMLSTNSQSVILAALLKTLPFEQLHRLKDVMADS